MRKACSYIVGNACVPFRGCMWRNHPTHGESVPSKITTRRAGGIAPADQPSTTSQCQPEGPANQSPRHCEAPGRGDLPVQCQSSHEFPKEYRKTKKPPPRAATKKDILSDVLVLALPIFTARHQATIVGVSELNFCVRDGNRWTLTTINTNSHRMAVNHPLYKPL